MTPMPKTPRAKAVDAVEALAESTAEDLPQLEDEALAAVQALAEDEAAEHNAPAPDPEPEPAPDPAPEPTPDPVAETPAPDSVVEPEPEALGGFAEDAPTPGERVLRPNGRWYSPMSNWP
jgi:hypothetical protein